MNKILFFLFCLVNTMSGGLLYAQSKRLPLIIDMVHHNPGEALTQSKFSDPRFVKTMPFNGQVMNDFVFAHTAITFRSLDKQMFLPGSEEYNWIKKAAATINKNIQQAHAAGLKAYYFTDLIVLPKKLVQKYKDSLCDANGKISFEKPFTLYVHRLMLRELFESFPNLDGLVIRTGETYLNNVPYHTGNNPITNGAASHIKLINLLREEVCEKRNKTIIYRTWSFGGMHDSLNYYLQVTDQIKPHPKLVFAIKHTQGDYHRTYPFNPTIGKGKHAQIIEVQCQREYEGKGAFPNYVMDGVINGFEEYAQNKGFKGLKEVANTAQFAGVYTWSRGGGWRGPYIKNEFWCKLNAFVASNWAANTHLTEKEVFDKFMDAQGIRQNDARKAFRQLCLLSAKAVLRGHASALYPVKKDWVFWMRDHFLAGCDTANLSPKAFPSEGFLHEAFTQYLQQGVLDEVVKEKYVAQQMWDTIVLLSKKIITNNRVDDEYIRISALYGAHLHAIIASGWHIMALGMQHDNGIAIDKNVLKTAIAKYDAAWMQYEVLEKKHKQCASLYVPYAFIYKAPDYHNVQGLQASVNKYRLLVN